MLTEVFCSECWLIFVHDCWRGNALIKLISATSLYYFIFKTLAGNNFQTVNIDLLLQKCNLISWLLPKSKRMLPFWFRHTQFLDNDWRNYFWQYSREWLKLPRGIYWFWKIYKHYHLKTVFVNKLRASDKYIFILRREWLAQLILKYLL